jgi:adenylate cyclase
MTLPILHVGDWRLDVSRNELARGEWSVRLEPKCAEVLAYLAGRPGEVVSREALLEAIWPGVVVGDDVLTQAVIKLRKALRDDVRTPAYIETIAKRGYRLIAPVRAAGMDEVATVPPPAPARSRAGLLAGVAAAVLAGAVLLVALHPGLRGWLAGERGARADAVPVIAVLPFANPGGDPARTYFSDGITEDIIHALGRASGVRVIARNSVEVYRDRPAMPQAVRRELGARYLVQGSVREAAGRLRISVELSDAEAGLLLWSEQYDGGMEDVFRFQDRIVRTVAGKLPVRLTQLEERRVSSRPVANLEAYQLVLRARAALVRPDRRSNREARDLLERAERLAPEYAELHVAMAVAEYQRVINGWTEHVNESLRRAEERARRALSLDEGGAAARAHAMLGSIHARRGRFAAALAEVSRAIEINPSDTEALIARGGVLLYLGRLDEAIDAFEAARRFDPRLLPARAGYLPIAYYVAGRLDDALRAADTYVSRYPDVAYLHVVRAATLAQLGRVPEARKAAARARALDPLFRVENWGTQFLDPALTARMQEGARKAGL